jgi:hypothetical protein
MAAPSATVEKSSPAEPTSTPAVPRSKMFATVVWVVVACLLLGASAVVREIQERRHSDDTNYMEDCPFPLGQIPRTLGRWKNTTDDQKLDSKTLLITGGKDYSIRMYTDETTGVKLVVLLLYGPLEPVVPHVPEVCYPANGFQRVDLPLERTLEFTSQDASGKETGQRKAVFRSAVYGKGRALEGVYHSFRFQGEWSPDPGAGQKLPRRKPGVFKVQIQRLVVPGESRNGDKYPEPIETFLDYLIPAIEQEISHGAVKLVPKRKPDLTALAP